MSLGQSSKTFMLSASTSSYEELNLSARQTHKKEGGENSLFQQKIYVKISPQSRNFLFAFPHPTNWSTIGWAEVTE